MDYYQGVVLDYLRADRTVFVNPECCIQLNENPNPDKSGAHWYCDAVAVDFRAKAVYLCEISYATKLSAMIDRLKQWNANWLDLQKALVRDCKVPHDWPVRPWLFVPELCIPTLVAKLKAIVGNDGLAVFQPRITSLESVQPWQYCSWNHQDKDTKKSDCIPAAMQV
jgi:hypothetical protein